jgi:hypothetical protein
MSFRRIANKQKKVQEVKTSRCSDHIGIVGALYRKCHKCGQYFPVPDLDYIAYKGITGRGDSPIVTQL